MMEYISREMALKKLQMQLLDLEVGQDKGEYSELCENRGARDALDEAIYDIRTLKSADVQPIKHGQWIDCTFYDPCEKSWEQNYEYKCSYCGHIINNKPNDDNRYCGHCSARMDLKDGDVE